MGFEIKTEEQRNPTQPVLGRIPKNRTKTTDIEIVSEDNLTQNTMSEEDESKLALTYIMETQQYHKFLIWIDIQNQINSSI